MHTDEYFAGLFDGEGTVGIYCADNGRKTSSGQKTYYVARLSLSGTFRPMVEACQGHFKVGVVRQDKRQTRRLPNGMVVPNAQTRPSYRWNITKASDIRYVLNKVQPWLIEKAEQVRIVLDFMDGKIEGSQAKKICSEAKNFVFDDFIEPPVRSGCQSSEENPNARLTYKVAETIRKRVVSGERQVDVARDLDISKTMVSRIVKGHTYTTPPRCTGAEAE